MQDVPMTEAAVQDSITISRCVACDQPIPALIVGAAPSRREWECLGCGASYRGTLADGASPHLRDRIRLVHYFPQYIKTLPELRHRTPGIELRRHRRRNVTMKIPVTPLDNDLYPVGDDFEVLSRNLSESGVGLLHHEPLRGKFAALVVLPDLEYVQLVLRIVRCEPMGSLYEMGAKFLKRID